MTDQAWTRATTVANTLADRYGLEKWAKRNVALGLGLRPDLVARAASCTPEDRKTLEDIVSQAEEAARARSGANIGSALHDFTERIDRGEDFNVIPPWDKDVAAYKTTLARHNIRVLDGWIERVVIVPQVKVAGTLDRIVTVNGDGPYIADLKTGSLDYSMGEIAVQLSLYAGATHAWKGTAKEADNRRDRWGRYLTPDIDTNPDEYEPMPAVSRDKAIVIHLPAGEAKCTLHWVDIAAGREAVRKAMWVREWRKRKDLSTPLQEGAQVAANF